MHKIKNGFSLVEVMVGMVIGLIGVLVIFQVYSIYEGQKRTTTSGSDAQQNGMVALYTMEQDIRQAGYGISNSSALGCTTTAWINGASTTLPPLTPVALTQNANGNDSITLMYGNSATTPAPARLVQAAINQTDDFKIENPVAYNPGDLVIAFESGKTCALSQIDAITPAGCVGSACNLQHLASPQYPYNPVAGQSIFPAGGYTTNAQLLNLGSMTLLTYGINTATSRLTQTSGLTGTTSEIADNIVNLRAQYGWDSNNNGVVEPAEYVDANTFPNPATAAQWAQVLSIRIALLARGSLREKTNAQAGYACTVTTTVPGPAWAAFTMRNDADGTAWQCYRYKSYETVVPLRNIIWLRSS